MTKTLIQFSLTLTLLFSGFISKAQTANYKKDFMDGLYLVEDKDYKDALTFFKLAYSVDSTNANINYQLGLCYLHHPKLKHLAEGYLEKAVKDVSKGYVEFDPTEKSAPTIAYLYLGQAYHFDYKFDDAEKMYETFESYLRPNDKKAHDLLKHYRQQIVYAKQYVAGPEDVKITNLGPIVNSIYPDFSPVLSADERTLFFTSARNYTTGAYFGGDTTLAPNLTADGQFFEDVVFSNKLDNGQWTKPQSLGPQINGNGHEGAIGLSADGQTLIVYRDDAGDGNLYYSEYDGNDWTSLTKYGSNINSKYWEPSACLSRDGNTLYFVSDRPGGFGGRDIYRCVKLPNGAWSLAKNLGPKINTAFDEESPFMHPDGMTFFFSSQGHTSMGGFDIMFSIIDAEGNYSDPINIGYPVNTTDDDLYYVSSPDNKRGYYASSHEEGDYGETDIYTIEFEKQQSNPLALFKGQIKAGKCDPLPTDIVINVTNIMTNELVGVYRPVHETGTFACIIPPGYKYNFSFTRGGKEFHKEEVFVSDDISYEEIHKELKLPSVNLCPEDAVVNNTSNANILLNVLVLNNKKDKQAVANSTITLKTKGDATYTGTTDANGKINSIALVAEKNYDLTAESNGLTASNSFNTIGITGNKTIEKTLYLEKSSSPAIEILLNVLVLNKQGGKPVANAKVILSGKDGFNVEATTDENGKVIGTVLSTDKIYQVVAENGNAKSNKGVVSTMGLKKSKTIEKTLYVNGDGPVDVPDNSEVVGTKYKFYFKYDMNEVDEQAPEYVEFIDNLVKMIQTNGGAKLYLVSSASMVPTHGFKNNHELAESRVTKTKEKVLASLKAKGISESSITFITKAIVSGPNYQGDWNTNRKTYEKFQYVKITGK